MSAVRAALISGAHRGICAAGMLTHPDDLAAAIQMWADLPKTANPAEFCVNCQLKESD